MSVEWNISAQTWTLSGGNTSYVLHRDAENRLLNLYWGPRLPGDTVRFDPADYISFASFDLPVSGTSGLRFRLVRPAGCRRPFRRWG